MVRSSEYLNMGVVTGGAHKVDAVRREMPEANVIWVHPHPHVDERVLSRGIPHDVKRSAHIAQEKAREDVMYLRTQGVRVGVDWLRHHHLEGHVGADGKIHMSMYSDVTQYLPEIKWIMERPRDMNEWLDSALQQSGRAVWITVAHTGVRLDRETDDVVMHTVGVTTKLRTRNFTKPEIRAFAEKVGIDQLMDSAGGMPIRLTSGFFDKSKEVAVYYYPNAMSDDEPVHVTTIPWKNVDDRTLRAVSTGAFRKPLKHLVDQVLPVM